MHPISAPVRRSTEANSLTARELSLQLHSRFLAPLSDHRPQNGNLNILHHNAHSLFRKMTDYISLPHLQCYDILAFSETWFQPAMPDALYSIPGFDLFRCDRHSDHKSTGGGTAMYVKSTLKAEPLSGLAPLQHGVDAVWLRMATEGRKIIIGSIYSPPDIDKTAFVDSLSTTLEHSAFMKSDLVIIGDLNINWNRDSGPREKLREVMDHHNLDQKLRGLSYVSASGRESLIDLGFVSRTLRTESAQILTSAISDHYAACLSLGVVKEHQPRRLISTRSIRKALPRLFQEGQTPDKELLHHVQATTSASEKAERLEHWVLKTIDHLAPIKTLRVRPDSAEWLTHDLKRLVSSKNRFFRLITSRDLTPEIWAQYKKFRNHVQAELKRHRREFYAEAMSKDTSSLFKQVNSLLGRKTSKHSRITIRHGATELREPHLVANHLNHFFTSLTAPTPTAVPTRSTPVNCQPFTFQPVNESEVRTQLLALDPRKCGGIHRIPASVYKCLSSTVVPALTSIINTSLASNEFPNIYKEALVTPIFKKGSKVDPSNYRPISSLPILSKIFESLLNKQIQSYLTENSLLSTKQFGFRQGLSTEHMLLQICETYLKELDSKSPPIRSPART